MKEESDRLGRARADVIKGAMSLLWKGYSTHAWGFDEVIKKIIVGGLFRPVISPNDNQAFLGQ